MLSYSGWYDYACSKHNGETPNEEYNTRSETIYPCIVTINKTILNICDPLQRWDWKKPGNLMETINHDRCGDTKKRHHQKTNIWIHINQLPKSWIIWLPMGARYSTTFTTPFWHLKVAPPKDDKHFYEIIKYANWVIIISKSPNKSCVEDLYNSCEDPNIVKLVSVHSGTDIGIPRFLGIPHFGIPRNLGIYPKISVYHQVT